VRPRGARHVDVIDQRALPHALVRIKIASADTAALAIRKMWIRGAPLIGAVGAYGLALALDRDASDEALDAASAALEATRPTAVNLRWALERVRARVAPLAASARGDAAWAEADAIVEEDMAMNRAIGEHGIAILRGVAHRRPGPVRVMTHCNAGALATCGWGTATSPIFLAHLEGLPLDVWVSETRPRMQGANLTAWELGQRGVPHTLVSDSACPLLMQRGEVDLVIVGADRVARNGDVCNKIGTYGKALAARESNVPFYVALPSPTIDWRLPSGEGIPIEVRDGDEVTSVTGRDDYGQTVRVTIAPPNTKAHNFAFDVTPARLVTGFVTERGITRASREWLSAMFPDKS
jgi:methylthioribose-1-phosphate isomerase